MIESDWPLMFNWSNSSSCPFVSSPPLSSFTPLLEFFSFGYILSLSSELNVRSFITLYDPLLSLSSVFFFFLPKVNTTQSNSFLFDDKIQSQL